MKRAPYPIGIIADDRLELIPVRSWAAHEFCFHLHDRMLHLLQRMAQKGATKVPIEITSGANLSLLGSSPIDFLRQSGMREAERRVTINAVVMAIYGDASHFIYEALRALEKRKYTVAFSLLRKPFREAMFLLARIVENEDSFFDQFEHKSHALLSYRDMGEDRIIAVLSQAIEKCGENTFLDAKRIYRNTIDRKSEEGLAPLFDKASHLVTSFSAIRTEKYNLNFVFKNPFDDDVYADEVYRIIAECLLFLSLMQIELCSRMDDEPSKGLRHLQHTSVGTFAALFAEGRTNIARRLNKTFEEFFNCPMCDGDIRLERRSVPRFLIGETLECSSCGTTHHFPYGWITTRFVEK